MTLYIIVGTMVILVLVALFIMLFGISRKRLLQAETQRQKLIIQHQSALIQNNLQTQEEERRRLAANLHDDIGSKLNVIKLFAHQFRSRDITNDRREQLAREMMSTLQKTIDTTRSISHQLYPPTLENFGLIAAVKELSDDINDSSSLDLDFQYHYDEQRVDSVDVELNLLRVLQECIQNSIKYGASLIELVIEYKNKTIDIRYVDNGPGYDPTTPDNQKGMGIQNIHNRIALINATIKNLSAINQGARYRIHFNQKS